MALAALRGLTTGAIADGGQVLALGNQRRIGQCGLGDLAG
jgi:hypothetical protein